MNSTFKCWLIANFEIVACVFTLIAGCIYIFLIKSVSFAETNDSHLGLLYFSLLVFNVPTKNAPYQFVKYFLLLGFAIAVTVMMKQDPEFAAESKKYITWLWIFIVSVSAISGWLAHYVYNNIAEVVSRRMLYVNSRVSLFEYTWKYTLDRFCNIAFAIVSCTICLVATILVY